MYHEETKLVRKNGSYFLASVQLQSLYDEEKYLIGFIAIIQDLLQLAQDAIFVRNINNEIIFWNKGAESTYGWLKDEVSGQITHNILKTIFPIPLNEIEEQLSKQNQWSGELIHTSKDGRQIIVESRWAIQRDQKGRPIGTLEVNRDITKRKKVEQDLQNREKELTHTNKKLSETEEFQKLIKESIPDIIFVKDSEFKIVEGNSSFFNIYPKEMRDKIIGFTTVENFHPEHAEQFLEKDREAFEKGRSEIIETVQFPDGRIRTLHTHKIRFHNNSDQVYIMGIAHDITEREDLIQKLLDSNTELERFAYVASHDLQEPIRMITNFSKIIAEDYKNKFDEEGLKYLHIIENAGTRMHDTINDLLEYSRIGNEAMQFVWFKCDDIAASTLENLKILIEEKQAEITYDKLPMIFGNPVQITRLLQNLITNGIKYQPLNNPPKLEIKYEENDTHWCILIKDNGLGIKEKFSTEIFQPFRRLHTWDNIKGTGLGLAICKKIVENHSGKIWVTAAETKGSLFRFTLLKPALKIRE